MSKNSTVDHNWTTRQARQLTLLGILLQSLHVLFGVTAFIGVMITQTRIHSTYGTIYHSHLRWQFVTFWLACAGYAAAFYLWITQSNLWLLAAVILLLIYRIGCSVQAWITHRAIDRWL